jgi:6-phosphogluconolactonase
MSEPDVQIVRDTAALADIASGEIEQILLAASDESPARIALAGGHTPRATYQHLAARPAPWRRIAVFFGDERCVPPDDDGSNYLMAHEAFLSRVPLKPEQIHRIPGELEPPEAAFATEEDLKASFPGEAVPSFDLILLGLGPEGHTASLFPDAPELDVTDRLAVPVNRPDLPQPWRVSFTLPVLNAAKHVMFLVDGEQKAPVAARSIAGDRALPAGRVRPEGKLTWIVTESAAKDLPGR